ncbi:caspase family protein [Larkinella punicea]|uniref:Uncharacterized protein n=1 Tax=Larkinella punicea TaxID=2315727 RepID=A0A368JJP6_9BACT|nr:caspase family protein [Larkinella punicea]RCR67286.1 hypothetical protein DUE52_22390 [Larkinella punicea]
MNRTLFLYLRITARLFFSQTSCQYLSPTAMSCLLITTLLLHLFLAPFAYAQKPELVVPVGHTSTITSVAISPNGKYAISGSRDKTVRLWEVETGREIHRFEGHTDDVTTVAFSSDGRYIISGGSLEDKSIILWDITTGREIRRFRDDKGFTNRERSRLYKKMGKYPGNGRMSYVSSLAFSRDGDYILSGSWDNTLRLWKTSTGKLVRKFKGHTGEGGSYVKSVDISPDGQYALSGAGCSGSDCGTNQDNTIRLWNVATGEEIRRFEGHTDGVYSVTFSPDSLSIISGSEDKTVRLWNVNSGREIHQFNGHLDALSPDGKYIISSGSSDHRILLWDVARWREIRQFPGRIMSVAFSPDGNYILGSSDDLKLWDIKTGLVARRFHQNPSDRKPHFALAPNGDYMILSSYLEPLQRWSFTDSQDFRCLGYEDDLRWMTGIALSPNEKYILSRRTWNNTFRLHDASTGKVIHRFSVGNSDFSISSIGFSPDNRYVFSGEGIVKSGGNLQQWDIVSGQLIRELKGHKGKVNSIAFSSDSVSIISTGWDQTIRLWDIRSGQQLHQFKGHTGAVGSAAFSPNNKYIVSGSWDKTVRLWDAVSKQEIYQFEGHTGTVNSVAFSPDGQYIVSGSDDNQIIVWNITTKEKKIFKGHTDKVTQVSFLHNGQKMLSSSFDNTIKAWDTNTGKEIATLIAVDSTNWVVTTPSGLFDASPGAMKLMYYVVNDPTDCDEPWKVIELDQLKQRYYQPGLLPILMGYRNEPLRQVPAFENVTLPPGIQLSIQSDKLIVQLNNRKGGIGPVSVFINGAEIVEDLRRDPKGDSNQNTLSLELPLASFTNHFYTDAQNSIRVVAQNWEGWLRSRPVEISYKPPITARGGVPEKTPSSVDRKTVRFRAVAVGTSNIGLHFAHSDAEQIANGLTLAASELFGPANVKVQLLVTKPGGLAQSTKAAIVKALVEAQQTKAEDVFVLHLSGHAVNYGGENGDLYFLLAGATSADVSYLNDPAIRQQYALSSQELIGYLRKIPAKKKVLILDVCSAGKGAEKILAARDVPGSQIRALDRLQERMGLYVLAGSAADAVSYEANLYGQGLVTYALLQGIKGAALRRDGEEFLDVVTWFTHVENQVPILAKGVGGIQKPFYRKGSHWGGSVPGQASEGSFDIGKVTESVKTRIHIAEPRPVLLVKNFQEVTEIDDVLDLKSKVESALNDFIASRGSDAPMLTMEAKDYPGAYTLNGLYTLQGEALSVSCKVKKGSVSVGDFVVTGTKSKLPDLVQAVLTKAKEFVKP